MSTPHINAQSGDFAESLLFPGDPLRAKFIADNFLDDAREVTSVRNMLGFTGTYRGVPVSVMGSGMGIPSMSIYAKELITEYGVKTLIRVGSAGGIQSSVKIRDVVMGIGACTDSTVNRSRVVGCDFAATASYHVLEQAVRAARAGNLPYKVGNLFSADLFYDPSGDKLDAMEKMGVLAVEMEAAGLYGVAAEYGAQALAICTISDHIRTGESLPAEDREKTFTDMMSIALEAVRMSADD